jgi:hypothetical protein
LRDFLQHGAAPFHGISRVGGLLGRFAAPVKRAIITWDPWFFRRFSLPECEKIAQSAGQLIPGWFYVILALIALIVVALFIAAAVCVLLALVRLFSRDHDSD